MIRLEESKMPLLVVNLNLATPRTSNTAIRILKEMNTVLRVVVGKTTATITTAVDAALVDQVVVVVDVITTTATLRNVFNWSIEIIEIPFGLC